MRMFRLPVALLLFAAITAIPAAYGQTFSLQFSGPPNEFISLGQTFSYNTSNASLTIIPGSGGAVLFDVRSPQAPQPFAHFWTLVLQPFPGTRLDPGVYSGAARWPFQFQQPGLSLFGDGRGCNTLTGKFTVISSSYSPSGELTSLHATFEQHCEGGPLAVTGEITVLATIPAVSPQLLLLLGLCLAWFGLIAIRRA